MMKPISLLTLAAIGVSANPDKAATTSAAGACPSYPACPKDNGCIWTDPLNKATFGVACEVDLLGGDMETVQANSYADCMNACAVTVNCAAASYRAPFCYLKNKVNPAVANTAVAAARLYGSSKATATTTPGSYTTKIDCPKNDNDVYTYAPGMRGKNFLIACGRDYYGGDLTSMAAAKMEDCVASCATNSACVGVSYAPSSKTCWLKKTITSALYDLDVNAARVYTS